MRHVKLITAAIMAIAAISALTATTAFGAQAEGFLPTTPEFIGSGAGGKLLTLGGKEIKCGATSIAAGTYATDSHGSTSITYTKCKAFGLFAANSLGDASETILAPSLWLLCLIEPKALKYGIWIEPTTEVHIEAAGKLVKVTGGLIGEIGINAKSLKKTQTFKQKGGDPEPKTCTGADGKLKTANQLTTEDGGTGETSALEGTATTEAKDKTTEIEIMDGI
jgi:hypothetical protein